MPDLPDYKALYEAERAAHEETRRKYQGLVKKLEPLLETIRRAQAPANRIREIMAMSERELAAEAAKAKKE